jgi:hypothetical protein
MVSVTAPPNGETLCRWNSTAAETPIGPTGLSRAVRRYFTRLTMFAFIEADLWEGKIQLKPFQAQHL